MNLFRQYGPLILAVIVLVVGSMVASAFTSPAQNPPNGNVNSLVTQNTAQTVTGLKTFNPAGLVPFAIGASNTGIVNNLNADKVDNLNASDLLAAVQSSPIVGEWWIRQTNGGYGQITPPNCYSNSACTVFLGRALQSASPLDISSTFENYLTSDQQSYGIHVNINNSVVTGACPYVYTRSTLAGYPRCEVNGSYNEDGNLVPWYSAYARCASGLKTYVRTFGSDIVFYCVKP